MNSSGAIFMDPDYPFPVSHSLESISAGTPLSSVFESSFEAAYLKIIQLIGFSSQYLFASHLQGYECD